MRPSARTTALLLAAAVLIWCGLVDSALLVYMARHPEVGLCAPTSGCGSVLASRYATVLGVPLSLIGGAGYFGLGLLLAFAMAARDSASSYVRLLAAMTSLGAVISFVLVALQLFVIQRICPGCMVSAVTMTTLAIVTRLLVVAVGACPPRNPCAAGALGLSTVLVVALLAVAIASPRPDERPLLEVAGRRYTVAEFEWAMRGELHDLRERWALDRLHELAIADAGSAWRALCGEVPIVSDYGSDSAGSAAVDRWGARYGAKFHFQAPPPSRVDLDTTGAASLGPANAPVEVVLVSDFECGFCKAVSDHPERLREDLGDLVRVVHMHNPLDGHSRAVPAACAAEAARSFGRFWQYRRVLAEGGSFDDGALIAAAERVGIAAAKFRQALTVEAHEATVRSQRDQVRLRRLEGTPIFVVNGEVLPGALPYEDLALVVKRTLLRSARWAE